MPYIVLEFNITNYNERGMDSQGGKMKEDG